ncbi:MAG TPA: BTAD domain-containing putative transcriptional regulator [Actinomycetes bacterium]
MEFRALGPLVVYGDDGTALPIRQGTQRLLLSLLLLHANQPLSSGWLAEALWSPATQLGDPSSLDTPPRPAGAAGHRLRTQVWALRRVLQGGTEAGAAAGRLQTSPGGGYLLRVAPDELDLLRFRRLAAAGRQTLADGDAAAAIGQLEQAVGLWRGAPLADLDPDRQASAVLAGELARLEEERLGAVEALVGARLAANGAGAVDGALTGELRALLAAYPLRERLWGYLMLALYRAGRQADALAAFAQVRELLVEELGVEPSPELQRLQRQILAADPALESLPERAAVVADPVPASVPRQLPADVTAFTGRERELDQLVALLQSAGEAGTGAVVVAAIDGMGGVGKSALAIHAAHQLAGRFPDGQLYLNLRSATPGAVPLEPLDGLGRMLRALGLDPGRIPGQVEEAAASFRTLAAGRRLLLVLDNAHDAEQVRPLLPASPSCAVLVTSRQALNTLDGAKLLHLDVLTQELALTLLGRLAGPARIATDLQAATEVVRYCGYLPLAIRIAAARLAARPTWPVAELASRLAEASSRLEELAVDDLGVRASFEVSLAALEHSADPTEQAAARAFGLLSLPDGPDLDAAAGAWLLDQPQASAGRLLERLVDARLLESPRPGRYQLDDLVRLYARQQGQEIPAGERLAALNRLVGGYLVAARRASTLLRSAHSGPPTAGDADRGTWPRSRAQALHWFETEHANLLAAAQQATTVGASPAVTMQLAEALFDCYTAWTHQYQIHAMAQLVRGIERQVSEEHGQPGPGDHPGVACEHLSQQHAALDCVEYATATTRASTDGGRAGDQQAGRWHDGLGGAEAYARYWQDWARLNRLALRVASRLGDRDGEAKALGGLSCAYFWLRRPHQALPAIRRCLTLAEQAGDQARRQRVLRCLGTVNIQLGRLATAIVHLEQSLAIARQRGDHQGQGAASYDLAVTHVALARPDAAIAHLERSLAIARRLGQRLDAAKALWRLGALLHTRGDHDRARAAQRDAQAILEQLDTRVDP